MNPINGLPTSPAPNRSPRFGNLAMTFANTLEPITNSYAYQFLVNDLFGLGVPRSVNAAYRSRDQYDPRKDPKIVGMSPLRQPFYILWKKLNTLNWGNVFEELIRDLQTGPLLLFAQTVFILGAMKYAKGKQSLMIGWRDLEHLKNSFSDFVQSPQWPDPLQILVHKPASVTPAEYFRRTVQKNFLNHFFTHQTHLSQNEGWLAKLPERLCEKDFQKQVIRDHNHQEEKAFIQFLGRHFNLKYVLEASTDKTKPLWDPKKKTLTEATYRDVVEALIHEWRGRVDRKTTLFWPQSGVRGAIEQTEKAFKRLIYWFNVSTNPALPASELMNITVSLEPNVTAVWSTEKTLQHLRRFRGFINNTLEISQTATTSHQPGFQNLREAVTKTIPLVFRRATITKGLFISIVSTTIAGLATAWVAFKAQHSKVYPANRNYLIKGGQSPEKRNLMAWAHLRQPNAASPFFASGQAFGVPTTFPTRGDRP